MTAGDPTPLPIRLITFNIRYASPPESRDGQEQPWSVRRAHVGNALGFHAAGLPETMFGLQEVLYEQLRDLHGYLNGHGNGDGDGDGRDRRDGRDGDVEDDDSATEEWQHIGVGRDDGRHAGEHEPIFYRPAVWALLATRHLWISATPTVPSRGWDAACTRIMTIGTFRHRATGRRIVVMNVHLDHRGEVARREGAKLILRVVDEYVGNAGGGAGGEGNSGGSGGDGGGDDGHVNVDAVLLMGDFNDREDGPAYRIVTAKGTGVRDCRAGVSEQRRYGNVNTFSGFGGDDQDGDGGGVDPAQAQRIDFVFKKDVPGRTLKVTNYAVLANRFDDGVYASDHRPVVSRGDARWVRERVLMLF